MTPQTPRIAVVTGASSGIGAASARALAGAGFHVICAARRTDRITDLAAEIGGTAITCDVTDPTSVASLVAAVGPRLDVLVNNAGGAFDAHLLEHADLDQWRRMYEVNVLGVVRTTQALLPSLRAADSSLIINIGSTAGQNAYAHGGGYTAAKHGLHAVTQTMRLELNGEPIRITEIVPGMVRTEEFALVRFGDQERADAVYADVDSPLVAEDVAEAVRWIATLPRHFNVDEITLRPVAQAAQFQTYRGPIFG